MISSTNGTDELQIFSADSEHEPHATYNPGANMPEADPDPLLGDLASASTHARCRAALELGTRADPAAAEALMAAFTTESDDYVRETLVRALVRVGDHVVDPLIRLLAADSRQLRHHAAHALSKLRHTRAVDPLIVALGDAESSVAYKAAFALGRIGDPRAIGSLIVLLDHAATEVRSAAN